MHTAGLEIEYRISAHIKNAAIGAENGLPMMMWEEWLQSPGMAQPKRCSMAEEILTSMMAARTCAHQLCQDALVTCVVDVSKLLQNSHDLLLSLDLVSSSRCPMSSLCCRILLLQPSKSMSSLAFLASIGHELGGVEVKIGIIVREQASAGG